MHLASRTSWLLAAVTLGTTGLQAPAHANHAIAIELDRPSTITPRTQHGLFTSIANAGRRLVAVGEQGRIVLSDDNGLTWYQVVAPTSVTLTKVRFASDLKGWAVGQMGVVLGTQDGGLTWHKQFDGVAAGKIMLSAAEARLAAKGNTPATEADLQAAQIMVQGGPNVPFLAVLPVSLRDLFIAGGFGIAYASGDGGASWQAIAADIPNETGLHIYDLVDLQGKLLGVGEQGLLFLGPLHGPFTTLPPPSPGSFFGALVLADQSLLIYGLQGAIWRSINQGKSWTRTSANVTAGLDCGVLLRNGNVVLGDVAGDLLLSQDNGTHFLLSRASEPVVSLAQAADGAIIIGGPSGLMRISSASLKSGI